MKHELHPAAEADKESIYSLNKRCYREVVERQFETWDEDFQRGLFERKWNESAYLKITHEGEIVGVLVVEEHDDSVFLSEIQVAPERQSRGLGTQVISGVIDNALKNGMPVRLRVLLQSRAKTLYERLGFVVTGETETHYLMENLAKQVVADQRPARGESKPS